MEEKTCTECKTREECVKPCKLVNKILWEDNRIMEKHYASSIVCYPMNKEVQFSGISEEQMDGFSDGEYELEDTTIQDATLKKNSKDADVVPWSSGDLKLRKTAVFVERFFNKVSCKELADRFGVKENTIVCMYAQAVEQLEKMIDAMDARREGLKACKKGKFTDDQKFFLLIQIFGFNGYEVAKIFGLDHRVVSMKVKRMTDKYLRGFSKDAEGWV